MSVIALNVNQHLLELFVKSDKGLVNQRFKMALKDIARHTMTKGLADL